MTRADALLEALADLVAERVAERLRPSPAQAVEFIDQHTCGFDRRTYVRAARAGEFPASKVGRRWIAKRSDVSAWLEARRQPATVSADPDVDDLRRRLNLPVRHAS